MHQDALKFAFFFSRTAYFRVIGIFFMIMIGG